MTDSSNTPTIKSYPASSPQVAQMFGFALDNGENLPIPSSNQAVNNHPIANLPVQTPESLVRPVEHSAPAKQSEGKSNVLPPPPVSKVSSAGKIFNVIKAVTPYVAVFSVALVAYFYFFSGASFNFGKVLPSEIKVSTPKESSLAALEKQNLTAYNTWIALFYYDVSDFKVLDPEADTSGNGLSNFQKYLLNLNPKSYDTLGLGMADSQAINSGINPLSGNKLTDGQKAIVDKYFDMEVIMNRLTLENLQKSSAVAGANTLNNNDNYNNNNNIGNNSSPTFSQPSQTQAPIITPRSGTNMQTQAGANQVSLGNLDGGSNIDTSVPGHLDIPSLKISAPLIWSTDTKNFDKDLQSGVIHYPGTALPGQIGTTYISGHSSNYAWAKGDYNHVFTYLDNLPDSTSFSITVTLKGGKTAVYHYVVTSRKQYSPTDQAQFLNSGKSVVALSTCWPVGSTAKRLVVFGELTQVEN